MIGRFQYACSGMFVQQPSHLHVPVNDLLEYTVLILLDTHIIISTQYVFLRLKVVSQSLISW